MQGVSSLLDVFQRYFAQDILLTLIVAALPWLIKDFSKKQKLFVSGIIAGVLLLFNVVTFWLMNKLGEGETYYRFFWALPCGCIFAALVMKLWDQLKDNWQKLCFVILGAVMALMYSNMNPAEWLLRDLYYLPEETILIADMIEADSDNKVLVNVYDYSDAVYGIREYDANIVLVDDGVEDALDTILKNDDGDAMGRLVCAVVRNNEIEYVYVEKEKENVQMALLAGGGIYVGETKEHRLYRFQAEEVEQKMNLAINGADGLEIFAVEYTNIPGVQNQTSFVYETDGSVKILDENLALTNQGFAGEEECQTLDMGEYYICGIDNTENHVSAETVEAYAELEKQGKPIVLLLKTPLKDGKTDVPEITDKNMLKLQQMILAEDSKTTAIYAMGDAENTRSKLENGIIQCVCISKESNGNAMITIRGEAKE